MNANEIAIIDNSLQLVSSLIPGAEALILGVKTIWLVANPGKTDPDWVAGLATASTTLTTAADQQLIKDGWTLQADGSLKPPS